MRIGSVLTDPHRVSGRPNFLSCPFQGRLQRGLKVPRMRKGEAQRCKRRALAIYSVVLIVRAEIQQADKGLGLQGITAAEADRLNVLLDYSVNFFPLFGT